MAIPVEPRAAGVPSAVLASSSVTVPVAVDGLTVVVKVTVAPNAGESVDAASVVVEDPDPLTVTVTLLDVLPT